MKRFALCALAAFALGCAGGAARSAVATGKPPPAALPSWPEYTLELVGLRVGFPSPPTELAITRNENGIELHIAGFTLDHEGVGYVCARAWVPGHDRAADDQALSRAAGALAAPGARAVSIQMDGFRGVAVDGVDKDGDSVVARAYAIGDGTVYASVSAPAAKLDRAVAEHFVRGCRFVMPWRVHGSLDGNFTVTVPAAAIQLPGSQIGLDEHTVGRAFVVGGVHETTYIAAATTIAHDVGETTSAEDLLDLTVEHMRTETAQGHWAGAIKVDGVPGRDLWWTDEGTHFRWRLIATPTHLIQLGITSKSKDVIRSESSKRFLESLRRGPED